MAAKRTVRARAPLRLGLAGGGTDLSPFCDLYGGCVLNATIDMYAYAIIETRTDRRVRFVANDLDKSHECEVGFALACPAELALQRAAYLRIMRDFCQGEALPLTLTTYCDAPPGSGLGSSSTVVVAMIKAFVEFLNLPLGEYDIARLAYEIERVDLKLSGGRQDQYAATFGGFNFMEFYADERVVVNPLRVKNWIISEIESSLVLYYSGVSRVSATIIDEQVRNVKEQNCGSLEALHELKADAVRMKEAVLKGDFSAFSTMMARSWLAKKKTATRISTDAIEKTYSIAEAAGAVAGKVSGAGGGGFIMFLVDPSRRMDLIRALSRTDGQVRSCHFTKHGTEGWRLE
jgi:D-glycero-alpha-D-manno-heptose-7-phosphate kinase